MLLLGFRDFGIWDFGFRVLGLGSFTACLLSLRESQLDVRPCLLLRLPSKFSRRPQ